jgi:hypothetical protein
VTTDTLVTDAMDKLFVDELADVLVLDAATGSIVGVLSNFETTSTLASKKKKKKKADIELTLQSDCHTECEQVCAERGGCRNHGVADYGGDVGLLCTIICNDERGTVGETFPPVQTLPD